MIPELFQADPVAPVYWGPFRRALLERFEPAQLTETPGGWRVKPTRKPHWGMLVVEGHAATVIVGLASSGPWFASNADACVATLTRMLREATRTVSR